MLKNYYLKLNNEYDYTIHVIGKQYEGCKFLFNGKYIKSFKEWDKLLREGNIVTEYDKIINYNDFINLINSNQNKMSLIEYWNHFDISEYIYFDNGFEFSS